MDDPLIKSSNNNKIYSSSSNTPKSSIDKLENIKSEVNDIKVIMINNIDKVIERKESLDVLCNKTDSLSESATKFNNRTKRLHRKLFIENVKRNILIFLFVVAIITIISLLIYLSAK